VAAGGCSGGEVVRGLRRGLLALLALQPAGGVAAQPDCTSIDRPKCTVELSTGITMAYLEAGPPNGDAVILVHGLTDSGRSWTTTMDALVRDDPGLRVP
jgi:hypothetical protein